MVREQSLLRTLILIATLGLVITSCSDSGTSVEEDELTTDQQIAINYFKEIALGFEFGNASDVTRKWNRDIRIYKGGVESEMLDNELDDVISDLNELISRDGVELSLTSDSTQANVYLFFGPGRQFGELYPPAADFTDSNFGLFFVRFNASDFLTNAWIYVDTERPAEKNQRHLLREELTQALGMAQDSPRFDDSIFQVSYSTSVTEYSKYDEAVIQLLYHPEIRTGLFASEVEPFLVNIVDEIIQ